MAEFMGETEFQTLYDEARAYFDVGLYHEANRRFLALEHHLKSCRKSAKRGTQGIGAVALGVIGTCLMPVVGTLAGAAVGSAIGGRVHEWIAEQDGDNLIAEIKVFRTHCARREPWHRPDEGAYTEDLPDRTMLPNGDTFFRATYRAGLNVARRKGERIPPRKKI